MAEFKMLGPRQLGAKTLSLNGNSVSLNSKGTITFCFAEAEVEISTQNGGIVNYTSKRGVILAPDGVQVLPYFLDQGECKLVMVEQFRIAISGKTIEPPGGEADHTEITACMAQELREETGIAVRSEQIEIVFCEYVWPSMAGPKAWGGVVRIYKKDIPEKILHGEFMLGEYVAITIHPLVDILRLRDRREIDLDLWTSRLVDEVAKKVGLLAKNY